MGGRGFELLNFCDVLQSIIPITDVLILETELVNYYVTCPKYCQVCIHGEEGKLKRTKGIYSRINTGFCPK